jgi:hypothetical protein
MAQRRKSIIDINLDELGNVTVAGLRNACAKRGLSTAGLKEELIMRILIFENKMVSRNCDH